MRLSTNCNRSGQVVGRKGRQRIEETLPAGIPIGDQLAPCAKGVHKFFVPVSPRFLSIRGEEISPAGKQVACHMLHDDGNAVRIGVEGDVQLVVGELSDGLVCPPLVRPEGTVCSVDYGLAHVILNRHGVPSAISHALNIAANGSGSAKR